MLRLPVRYLAMLSAGPDDNVEANIAPVEETYELDPASCALAAMGARGYLPILLRDCTTAIEVRATVADFATTRLAIQDVERRYYTAESADLIAACRAMRRGARE